MKKSIKIALLLLTVVSSVTGLFGTEAAFKVVEPGWAREKLTAIVAGSVNAKDAFLEQNTYGFPLINTIAREEARVDVGLFVDALRKCSKEDLFNLAEDGTVSGLIFNTQDGCTFTIFHRLAISKKWKIIYEILGVLAEKGMTTEEWKAFAYYKGEEYSPIYETITLFAVEGALYTTDGRCFTVYGMFFTVKNSFAKKIYDFLCVEIAGIKIDFINIVQDDGQDSRCSIQ